jgi:outer membrane protein TolC
LDDTALKEAQSLLSSLEQIASSLGSQSTSQLERTIEAVTLQNAQSLEQLVNGAQQLFIRIKQMQLNIVLQQNKLKEAKLAVSKAETKLTHGLGTSASHAEAKLQESTAETELTVLKNQLQTMLTQLRDYTGYKNGEILTLGEVPEPAAEILAEIDIEADTEAAVAANYALKMLKIERVNASSATAKKKVDIQIEQQEAALRQNIQQKYAQLLETQAKLDLATAELRQAEQQLKTAETNFKLGKIPQNMLDSKKAALAAKQTAQQNAVLTMIAELEDYQSKINGLN